LSFDFIIGDNLRYELNYLSDNGKFFGYGFRAYYNAFSDNVATDLFGFNRIDVRYQDFTEQLYAEAFYKNRLSLGLGLELKHIKVTSETLPTDNGEDIYTVDNSHYFNAFTYLKSDTFDKAMYPKQGSLLDVEFRYYISSSDYYNDFNSFSQLTGNYSAVSSVFQDKLSLQFDISMGLSTSANSFNFFLGGYGQNYINNFRTLYGYEFGELFGEDFAKVAAEIRYEFIPKNYLNFGFNAAQVGEDIFKASNFLDKIDYGMAVGYGLETFIGPVDLKYGYSPVTKSSQWYFNLGFWF
jgi:NTE family protein